MAQEASAGSDMVEVVATKLRLLLFRHNECSPGSPLATKVEVCSPRGGSVKDFLRIGQEIAQQFCFCRGRWTQIPDRPEYSWLQCVFLLTSVSKPLPGFLASERAGILSSSVHRDSQPFTNPL
jgi:hypothetical protein